MFLLQPYKGKSTRHTCPSCGRQFTFTLYIDSSSQRPLHHTVGKCNREIKCGYHYTPRQYYIDNPSFVETWHATSKKENIRRTVNELKTFDTIPYHYVTQSQSLNSNFVSFLLQHFTQQVIEFVCQRYRIGATKSKEVIFWQIDINNKVRTGKIMQYDPTSGKRIKHQSGAINWSHNKLKQQNKLPENFNLRQCFFGEHLVSLYPNSTIAIVESEKTAIILSLFIPDMIWLAAGSLNGLSIEKCQVLHNRNVILFPDLGAEEKWILKSLQIRNQIQCKISVSGLLESLSTQTERLNGFDLADFLIMNNCIMIKQ